MLLARQILPAYLPGINHTGSGSRYSGTDPFSVGTNRHAHLRAERNRAGGNADNRPPHRGRLFHGQRARGASEFNCRRVIALNFDGRCTDRPSGVEDPTERKKRAVAKGRSALDVLDTLKLGLLDGSVDQSTLARLKIVSEGLADDIGRYGARHGIGRDQLARCGRAGQGRRPLGRRSKPSRAEIVRNR